MHISRIKAAGYLGQRAEMNYNRLEEKEYWPDQIFKEAYSWPGDWEGRIMLALVMLAKATSRSPLYLDEMVACLPEHLNEKGYFGPICPNGEFDEQQLSGNSWFLRALCELYEWKQDPAILEQIKSVVTGLLLPVKGYYRQYPADPKERGHEVGEAIGSLTGQLMGHWYPSTDIGCAFIMLDGASHAYKLLKWPELKELLEEMLEMFLTMDLKGLSFQTHATLSAIRGMLRFHEVTGVSRWLTEAEAIYNLYRHEAMTENYANYNWFGRPTSTEPCAIVDSFLVTFTLWKATRKQLYLDDMHAMLYNGLGYGQRPNGGFGCDTCAGAHDVFLTPKIDLFEAYWCCSMRGGDGLAQAIMNSVITEDENIVIVLYNNCHFEVTVPDGKIAFALDTLYPFDGAVTITVAPDSSAESLRLKMFIPLWTSPLSIKMTINGEVIEAFVRDGFVEIYRKWAPEDVLELSFPIELRFEQLKNTRSLPYHSVFRHGTLLLGIIAGEEAVKLPAAPKFQYVEFGCYLELNTGVLLKPINDMIGLSQEEAFSDRRQVLFENREACIS